MEIRAHKNLDVWKRAMNLTKIIYRITSTFPSSEQFGLVSQMRRVSVSVPSNIAYILSDLRIISKQLFGLAKTLRSK